MYEWEGKRDWGRDERDAREKAREDGGEGWLVRATLPAASPTPSGLQGGRKEEGGGRGVGGENRKRFQSGVKCIQVEVQGRGRRLGHVAAEVGQRDRAELQEEDV